MTNTPAPPPPPGLSLGDVYYVIFRHKWKIFIIAALGLVAALLLPFFWPRPYLSEAKLYIKYVQENRSPAQVTAGDTRIKSPDDRGENVINSELEILTSLDVAQTVVSNIGPEKILARLGGGADSYKAAMVIHKNLLPEVPKKSNVIRVVFQHPDPAVVQPVLGQIIEAYLNRHAEIHRGVFDDFLNKETDDLRSRLAQTEEALRQAKTNADVISVDDSKKALSEEMAKIKQAIFDAQAELAERQAAAGELAKLLNPKPAAPANAFATTNQPAATNQVAATGPVSATNALAATNEVTVPPDKVTEYKHLCSLLDSLQKREQDYLLQFTSENSLVKAVRQQIADNEKRKLQLETDYPGLLAVKVTEAKTAAAEPAASPRLELISEQAKVTALESKIRVLTNQLESIKSQARTLDDKEGRITDLQRRKELEESHYKYFSASLEQSKIDEALGASRVSNISRIQAPSPPYREASKLQKAMVLVFLASIAAAIALAFLLEFYLDRSLRRPIDIEAKIGLPLFLSIPLMGRNGKAPLLTVARKLPLLAEKTPEPAATGEDAPPIPDPNNTEPGVVSSSSSSSSSSSLPLTNHESRVTPPSSLIQHPVSSIQYPASSNQDPRLAPWDSRHVLRPFWDALRDRLITYFEIRNLTHKPKLVAVTSCGSGSGVTTIASGLAASLSETGDGNVLLVDMNQQQGAAHHFFKGDLTCGLDDALEVAKRENALVQDNLYVVREATNGDQLPRVLPKRFNHLVPKLKASDYDYIIFDMPPVSQISVTPRLARFMDMVLMVVESEKTDRDVVKRATAWLTESKANVGIVLNKAQTYVPKRLQQEL